MGNAGFISSTVLIGPQDLLNETSVVIRTMDLTALTYILLTDLLALNPRP